MVLVLATNGPATDSKLVLEKIRAEMDIMPALAATLPFSVTLVVASLAFGAGYVKATPPASVLDTNSAVSRNPFCMMKVFVGLMDTVEPIVQSANSAPLAGIALTV